MKKIWVVYFVACMALFIFTAQAQDSALRDMEGRITSLQSQMGSDKWTVVMIWASRCHVCNEEAPQYSAFHTRHANKDIKMIDISIDGEMGLGEAQRFILRHKLNYPNLIGDVRTVAALYQAQTGEAFRATPTFMVFDPEGKLQAAQAGGIPLKVIERFIETNS